MSAEMAVTVGDTGAPSVGVELFDGDPGQLIFVDLDQGDTLVATAGTDSMTLQEEQLATIVEYSAQFSATDAAQPFTIALERTVDAGAPASAATLPDPFTLGAVATSQSRAADLAVTWSPSSSDVMSWDTAGSCIVGGSGTIQSDQGTMTIAANTLVKASGNGVADACQVTVTLSRQRAGTLDSHFGHGGSIVGEQTRSATFTSTP
jgi:hypothetical protein